MCGLPFSGKTVLAQKLGKCFDIPIISIDQIREEFGYSWEDNERVTAADWDKVFTEMYKRLGQHLDNKQSIIYDSANQDRGSRDDLRAFAQKHHAKTKVIFRYSTRYYHATLGRKSTDQSPLSSTKKMAPGCY